MSDDQEQDVRCPVTSPLLTPLEACAWLRIRSKRPLSTLKYYRERCGLRGCRIGRQFVYPVSELERFVGRLLERQEQ